MDISNLDEILALCDFAKNVSTTIQSFSIGDYIFSDGSDNEECLEG